MPVITLYDHGFTGGVAPMKNDHLRALRAEVGGWSEGATRRNTRFLYSIREQELTGTGYAITLTIRDCPPDAAAWHRLRRAFLKRMERAGLIRSHWVTEWQRRGVPHLHGMLFFPDVQGRSHAAVMSMIERAWLHLGERYGAMSPGQHVHGITDSVGWFQYLSKHASRGVLHYQRSIENVPAAWKNKTGRMWGYTGDWPRRDGVRIQLQDQYGDGGWFAYRRLVRSWRVADARAAGDPGRKRSTRERSARAMLKCPEPPLSRIRGVSEWIPIDLSMAMLANLAARGYSVRS